MNGPTPMVLGLCAIVLFAPISGVAAAARCGDAAVAQAERLLQFHVAPDKDMPVNVERESVPRLDQSRHSAPAFATTSSKFGGGCLQGALSHAFPLRARAGLCSRR